MKNIVFLLFTVITVAFTVPAFGADFLSANQLKNDQTSFTILDVRSGSDWNSASHKIQDAVRSAPQDFGIWSEKLKKDGKYVLYCS